MFKLVYVTIFLLLYNYHLIVGGDKVAFLELTTNWSLRNENGSIEVSSIKLPSGVYTAIKKNYGDILMSKNDVNLRWVALENWTYTLTFKVDQTTVTDRVNLTLHGIDTVATIRLNGEDIGYTDNMFVRYSYDVTMILKPQNTLEVIIMSPILAARRRAEDLNGNGNIYPQTCPDYYKNGECNRNMLRKMQMSFGDDWNLAAPSLGIWKSVTLESYDVAIMRDVDVAANKDDTHWTMDIRVFISCAIRSDFYGDLLFYAAELLDEPFKLEKVLISYKDPKIEFKVPIPKEKVQLWWPNGYGAQKLYPLFVTINCYANEDGPSMFAKTISQKKLNYGFRTIELVEENDEFGRSFYFKVNDHPIFMKGANYIPAQILPEESFQSSEFERVNFLLQSAQAAHMNMIRVWGGGLYESDYFYNLADYYGLLVWQDMAFYGTVYPVTDDFVDSVRKETVQNAKRIAYHPSLAMITTNDEVELFLVNHRLEFDDVARLEREYTQLFSGTIRFELNIISRKSFQPRPGPMLSTPSNGLHEKGIPANPSDPNYGDVHLFEENKSNWDPNSYPWARFVSEYGIQSLPIKASWQRVLGENDTIADLIQHRQHDNNSFDNMKGLVEDWENNIEDFIYLSQVAQAISAKAATDIFRSNRIKNRTMGAIYWQLNDVWVAPTWSSIDFYGNYKMLYYWAKEFLKPIAVIALYDAPKKIVNVTLTREDYREYRDARVYSLDVYSYLFAELFPKKKISRQIVLDSNFISKDFMDLDKLMEEGQTEYNSFFEFVLSEGVETLSTTYLFPASFDDVKGVMDPELMFDIKSYCKPNSGNAIRINAYSIIITVTRPALFVYIEVNHDLITKYRLSENGFVMVEPIKTVHLEFEHASQCVSLSKENFTVRTFNKIIQNAPTTTAPPLTTNPPTKPTTPDISTESPEETPTIEDSTVSESPTTVPTESSEIPEETSATEETSTNGNSETTDAPTTATFAETTTTYENFKQEFTQEAGIPPEETIKLPYTETESDITDLFNKISK